jgi:hypothetical protein
VKELNKPEIDKKNPSDFSREIKPFAFYIRRKTRADESPSILNREANLHALGISK